MTTDAQRILASLQQVAAQRADNALDAQQAARVAAIKQYQQQRFRLTHAELLRDARYGPAANFFLQELYGPADYSERDAQFERVVPALSRLFPKEMVHTVSLLAELHALSESLDSQMARQQASVPLDSRAYVLAWQAVGQPRSRESQIQLMLQVGEALDRYTRNPLLRNSLRLMRGPARAAGLSSLQVFLEKGFDSFRSLRGAAGFLSTIAQQERSLAEVLFAADITGGTPLDNTIQTRLP